LTLPAAAREVGVDKMTVWRWVRDGKVEARRNGPSGWWKVRRQVIREFCGLAWPPKK
jgi:predicted site-specific integrase-resolvase